MRYKITKPIRLIELFAGIGSQAKALERLNADFEPYVAVDNDKFCVASYNALHCTSFHKADITAITGDDLGICFTDSYCYILIYSFPCQDISNAGLGKGMDKGSGTRSSLLWEVGRLLQELPELPQVLLMENVPAIIGKKFKGDFEKWLNFLEDLGYHNFYKILNAKDFGVPQNRRRCFMISLLEEGEYIFPEGFPLERRLHDMLEREIPEKYYLKEDVAKAILISSEKKHKPMLFTGEEEAISTLTAHCGNQGHYDPYILGCHLMGLLKGGKWDSLYDVCKRVYSEDGLAPTVHTMSGGDRDIKVYEPCIGALRGRNPENLSSRASGEATEQILELSHKEISNTITTVQKDNILLDFEKESIGTGRIRRLTPLECFRLMGFGDEDYHLARNAINDNFHRGRDRADTQLYKQAGNSIVVNVLEAIFKEML